MEMTLTERAAYIRGYCDGIEIDKDSKEGKVRAALTELISEMAVAIEDLEDEIDELREYIEEIDEDLGEVEQVLCEDCDDGCDCDGDCCCCDEDCDFDENEFFEIECPSCGEVVCFDESIDPEELTCPACGERFECIISEDDLADLDEE